MVQFKVHVCVFLVSPVEEYPKKCFDSFSKGRRCLAIRVIFC